MSPREQSSHSLTRSAKGLPRVVLRKRLGRAIRGGHPWIYRDALAASPRIADGSVVLVGGARAFYRELPGRLREAARSAGLTVDAILERRPRGRSGDADGERTLALFGTPADGEIEIRENGLRFGADLRRGQKGGLFLDQR